MEAPHLQAFYLKWAPAGVRLVAVEIQSSSQKVAEYAQGAGLTYPMLVAAGDSVAGTVLSQEYKVKGIPRTIIIDGQGIVRWDQVGGCDEQMLEQKLRSFSLLPQG